MFSLPSEPDWAVDRVVVTRNALVECGDLVEEEVDVPHASCAGHVRVHAVWLARGGLSAILDGSDLWAARGEYFPNLSFLPRVESDLRALPVDWLVPVRNRLLELQETVVSWDKTTMAAPLWRSLITPEHEQRKRYCEFPDLDGEIRVFDLHARFTPRHGRLHFRLLRDEGALRVAYIGSKLGV